MDKNNQMTVTFPSLSKNQAFSRVVVASFVSQLDPTLEEMADIKTAVSEAVTNAMIHGYENKEGTVELTCSYTGNQVEITVKDQGLGIANIAEAREPLYTSKPELERSGMGFTVMESFMDYIEIKSCVGQGTTVVMGKKINKHR